jgi:hypothetical protein
MSELSSVASLEASSQLVPRFSGSPSFLPFRVLMCVTHLLGLGNVLGYVAECSCECNLLPFVFAVCSFGYKCVCVCVFKFLVLEMR